MRHTGMQITKYKEYIGEIPINTIKAWGEILMRDLPWEYRGWSGAPKEPYRHWTSYPTTNGELEKIWEAIDFSFKEDGFNLKVDRIIGNLFAHGDSSWLHKDCDNENAWTAILYLNDHWDLNWGGETVLVENNEILKSFAPTPGKFILFKSNIIHGPRPVSREAPWPRFGLTFQCNDNYVQGLSDSQISITSAAKL
jgi:hypothetical protein